LCGSSTAASFAAASRAKRSAQAGRFLAMLIACAVLSPKTPRRSPAGLEWLGRARRRIGCCRHRPLDRPGSGRSAVGRQWRPARRASSLVKGQRYDAVKSAIDRAPSVLMEGMPGRARLPCRDREALLFGAAPVAAREGLGASRRGHKVRAEAEKEIGVVCK